MLPVFLACDDPRTSWFFQTSCTSGRGRGWVTSRTRLCAGRAFQNENLDDGVSPEKEMGETGWGGGVNGIEQCDGDGEGGGGGGGCD